VQVSHPLQPQPRRPTKAIVEKNIPGTLEESALLYTSVQTWASLELSLPTIYFKLFSNRTKIEKFRIATATGQGLPSHLAHVSQSILLINKAAQPDLAAAWHYNIITLQNLPYR